MSLNSARFAGDPILEQCAAGTFRMLEPQESLSVLRVQEALGTIGFPAGTPDGIFGPDTGAAVTAFKISRGLSPSDPVVGPGTSTALDAAVFVDPPSLDPMFGEFAPLVAAQLMEPFVAVELSALVQCPLNSLRHDIGFTVLAVLGSGFCVAMVAQSRAATTPDPRLTPEARDSMANMRGSAVTVPFVGTDGAQHVGVAFLDLTLMGRRFTVNNSGGRARVTVRDALCHELTHVRNMDHDLLATPDSDGSVYVDTGLAAQLSASTGVPTANALRHFVHEMVARHVTWITRREDAGDPFAARFLPPDTLAAAAHYYFTETDLSWFDDNGYMAACVRGGDPVVYAQIALWLRIASTFTFSGDAEANQTSVQLFLDAASSAEDGAKGATLSAPDGVTPQPADYQN